MVPVSTARVFIIRVVLDDEPRQVDGLFGRTAKVVALVLRHALAQRRRVHVRNPVIAVDESVGLAVLVVVRGHPAAVPLAAAGCEARYVVELRIRDVAGLPGAFTGRGTGLGPGELTQLAMSAMGKPCRYQKDAGTAIEVVVPAGIRGLSVFKKSR